MDQFYIYIAAFLLALLCLLPHFTSPALEPEEPPLVLPKIPLIGHIIEIIRDGRQYYIKLCAKTQLPAFTINMLHKKTYLIASASLVPSIQRSAKTISFDPFAAEVAERMAGISGDGLKLYLDPEKGGAGMGEKLLRVMHSVLLGGDLEGLASLAARGIQTGLDDLRLSQSLDLLAWCRHTIGLATTDAVYGPMNPYKKKEFEDAIHLSERERKRTYDSGLDTLSLNIFPALVARKAYKAREKLSKRFSEYFEKEEYAHASPLVQERFKVQYESGATYEDIGKLESSMAIALLGNTVPSTFWVVFDILSRPDLLHKIREEVAQNALQVSPTSDTKTTCIINMNDIRDNCPLLLAALQETLRLRASVASIRLVTKDTKLNDTYLLKANTLVQTPSNVLNRDPQIWGSDAHLYNPARFLETHITPTVGEKKRDQKRYSFMSFGTSPWTCPGRHLVCAEVLALVAMLIMRFDVVPVSGTWTSPRINHRSLALSIAPPAEGLMVNIIPRKEAERVEWGFKVMEGKSKFGLLVG
ncbi:cytochrome P450 [Emydomyces testavorans]|uniref:Cytochrome P450 n=1 Tax=Emydomyces testavorans TaxID=2070801 RepID=A0AAF0DH63_9EURO|nr:cytochrome P450 [Emydomyces testavorans]